MRRYTVFVDLDGVLVNFDQGVQAILGRLPHEVAPPVMWKRLAATPNFYGNLTWMPDGPDLWNFVQAFDPIILTGLPFGAWAEPQKRQWCARELGSAVTVITCRSKDKARAAQPFIRSDTIPLLVDDRLKLQADWEALGGTFVLHTDAQSTIAALKDLGLNA